MANALERAAIHILGCCEREPTQENIRHLIRRHAAGDINLFELSFRHTQILMQVDRSLRRSNQ